MSEHEWKDILWPVTIHQLQNAEKSPIFEDKSLMLEGRGFGAVTLVAHVTCVENCHPAKITYILEDGTGRICAEKDLDNLIHFRGSSVEAEEEERKQSSSFEHTYVEVTGVPQKGWGSKVKIKSIYPVQGYHQVMYHILNAMQCNQLIQQYVQPYGADMPRLSSDSMDIDIVDISSGYQDDADCQHHVQPAPLGPPVLPNVFSPQRQHPYAVLQPLEKAIMTYMHHNRTHQICIREVAQVIQASHGCTESQFRLALKELLSEAYVTSLQDDEYVIFTPRH